jgi:hypothetical protein
MKTKLALLLSLFAVALYAADMEITLDAPVTVSRTVTTEEQSNKVTVRYIVLDMQQKRIEVEFVGVPKRLVRQLTDQQFNAFRTSFVSSYGSILKGMITDHFTPPVEPAPTP